MLKKFNEAIDISVEIMELAQKINDTSLVEEKKRLISETKEKLESNTNKNEILTEINRLIPKLNHCILNENVGDAVSFYNEIIFLYKSINEEPSKDHKVVIDSYVQFYNAWEAGIES